MTEHQVHAADVVRILREAKVDAHVTGASKGKDGIAVENSHDHNVLIHVPEASKGQIVEKLTRGLRFTREEYSQYVVQLFRPGVLRVIKEVS